MKNSKNLWELIFGESRNGMSSASNIQHEMDFIKHHKSMKETLAQISQTEEQKRESLIYITNKTLRSEKTRPIDFGEQITFPSQDSKIESIEFMRNAESVLKGVKFTNHKASKDAYIKEAKEVGMLSGDEKQAFKDKCASYKDTKLIDNPFFAEGLESFKSRIKIPESYDAIVLICEYCHIQELLVCLVSGQIISIGVGFKVYTLIYYSLHSPEQIRTFFEQTIRFVQNPNKSNLRTQMFDIVYQNRVKISSLIFGTLGVSIGYHFGPTKTVIKEVAEQVSKYMPANEIAASLFVMVKETAGKTSYMITSVFSEARKAAWTALVEGWKPIAEEAGKAIKSAGEGVGSAAKSAAEGAVVAAAPIAEEAVKAIAEAKTK